MPISSSLPVVAHSTNPYLPMSQSWIYNQLIHLERYRPLVFTKRVQNVDTFPIDGLFPLYGLAWYGVAIEKLRRKKLGYFPYRLKTIQEQGACLLHSHQGQYGREDYHLARAAGIPHVVSFYGSDIWQGSRDPDWMRAYSEMFEASDLFLVEGNAMRNKVIDLGCDGDKVVVQHLGIDVEKIEFIPRTVGPGENVTLLMAGRAIEKKGHIYGLQAFARAARRVENARLLIMTWGDYHDTTQNIEALRTCIREEKLEDRVEIVGQQPYDEYLRRVRECHIMLNPSVHAENGDAEGGFPVTITESVASGMPVIATTHCDVPEIVRHGENGLVAEEKDVPALADYIVEMVSHPERWRDFADKGRALVDAEYNAIRQAERLEGIYDRLLNPA
jgi:colanic acid/amylovoran biosynthesis glycosyltransferase